MIVDCDTHAMLPDAFDHMDSSLGRLAPKLQVIIAEQGIAWIKPLAQLLDTKHRRKPRDFASEESGGRATVIQMRKASVPAEIRARGNQEPPSSYFKRNFSWTIETEEPSWPRRWSFSVRTGFCSLLTIPTTTRSVP
jgi:hypothetical protein